MFRSPDNEQHQKRPEKTGVAPKNFASIAKLSNTAAEKQAGTTASCYTIISIMVMMLSIVIVLAFGGSFSTEFASATSEGRQIALGQLGAGIDHRSACPDYLHYSYVPQ